MNLNYLDTYVYANIIAQIDIPAVAKHFGSCFFRSESLGSFGLDGLLPALGWVGAILGDGRYLDTYVYANIIAQIDIPAVAKHFGIKNKAAQMRYFKDVVNVSSGLPLITHGIALILGILVLAMSFFIALKIWCLGI
jgi:hypothetical protein